MDALVRAGQLVGPAHAVASAGVIDGTVSPGSVSRPGSPTARANLLSFHAVAGRQVLSVMRGVLEHQGGVLRRSWHVFWATLWLCSRKDLMRRCSAWRFTTRPRLDVAEIELSVLPLSSASTAVYPILNTYLARPKPGPTNAATPQRRNAATPQRRNAATPQRRNAATPLRSASTGSSPTTMLSTKSSDYSLKLR